ncbi:siderophore-interacting protein [Longispora sp. NPDC051575]|uniref:siderophore-interacting protein n=1 Tax=Longispora sp. NPDC051575 TaxID=3154943 RepID=UPI00343F6028
MTAAWKFFPVRVREVTRLSPSFTRVTFTGDDLGHFADNGYDQRIKLIVPLAGSGVSAMPTGADWFTEWRALPEAARNPVRTYTVRAVRPALAEVDVDLVLHGDGAGPAGRWALAAAVGDELLLLGPDARHDGPHGGLEFHPPADATTVLLAGDETAVPAIAGILERMPAHLTGEVVLEVPHDGDVLDLAGPPGVTVTWLAREDAAHGAALRAAVEAAAGRLVDARPGAAVTDIDVDSEILWEVPEEPAPAGGVYAWIAGEAAVVRTLRRHLVTDRGLDRRSVAFMGYWRLGRSETD